MKFNVHWSRAICIKIKLQNPMDVYILRPLGEEENKISPDTLWWVHGTNHFECERQQETKTDENETKVFFFSCFFPLLNF